MTDSRGFLIINMIRNVLGTVQKVGGGLGGGEVMEEGALSFLKLWRGAPYFFQTKFPDKNAQYVTTIC